MFWVFYIHIPLLFLAFRILLRKENVCICVSTSFSMSGFRWLADWLEFNGAKFSKYKMCQIIRCKKIKELKYLHVKISSIKVKHKKVIWLKLIEKDEYVALDF